MTDQQFQPGQTNPQTQQGGGVFGGNPENIIHDPSMFWPLEIPEESPKASPEPTQEISSSPFDGYVIPQHAVEETSGEKPVSVETEINPEIEATPELQKETSPEANNSDKEEVTPEIEPILDETTPEAATGDTAANETVPVIEEQDTSEEISQEETSEIQQKFITLSENVSELNNLLRIKDGEVLEIIWANTDDFSLLYQFWVNDQKHIYVKRIETNKEDNETNFNELKLWLNPESNLFEIFLDDVLLFEEEDLLEDTKKKSQVMEKLNKFIFLTESKLKDAQKELRAKQEEEEERKRLQDIFRNF